MEVIKPMSAVDTWINHEQVYAAQFFGHTAKAFSDGRKSQSHQSDIEIMMYYFPTTTNPIR